MQAFPPLLAAVVLSAPVAASPISDARQLTFEGKRAGEGYFSADGSHMIFQSERTEGNPFYQMYVLDFDTGDVERLSTGVGKTTCGWIHPDGERALFASTQFDPEAEEKMQAEIDFRESGQTRRYQWDFDAAYEIVETPIEGDGYTRLTDARGYDAEGAYSPDGERIVFASNRHAYAADLSGEAATRLERDPSYFMEIYVMDADGADVHRLTDAPGYDGGPFWSADGSKITWRRFSGDGARAQIYTMNADGSGKRQITELDAMSWAPFFHPSGEYLVFSSNLQGFSNFELYLVDVEGLKQPVRVTEREGFDGLATFAPDGGTISWTSNATPEGNSQIFIGDWDHEAALAMLEQAPLRKQASATGLSETSPDIAVDDIQRHVAALTAPEMAGRLTGTDGARRATAYAAEAFEAVGLSPAGDEGSWFQSFEFTAGVALGEDNALTISVDGEAETLARESWTPLAFSRSGEAEQAGVIFAGYGIVAPEGAVDEPLDSYGELDVTDRWVLVWRGMPGDLSRERRTALSRFADLRYKASVAKSRGAAGVIFAPPLRDGFEDGLPRMTYEATSGGGSLPVVAVDRGAMRRMLSILGEDAGELAARLEAGESAGSELIGVSASATIDLDFERRTGRSVLGRLKLDGSDDAGRPPLVIGAHVDHLGRGETSGSLAGGDDRNEIHPGADDNASGVAALIEVAQRLAARAEDGGLTGARDIIFAAWSGEELGLLGSSHFVDTRAEAAGSETLADAVSAYINMDMIGRLSDRVVVGGMGSSPVWEREVERRNAVIGLPIKTSEDPYLPTDATAFYLSEVPVLSLFTGAHEDYHRPSDTPEKLNYEGIRDIARFVALVARSRALDTAEPGYLERERPSTEGGRRMANVYLGTIPDYAGEAAKGVPLSGVVKGGPAEAAGLQGGDVVVGLAGQELADIYDYMRVLNGLRPDETVPITVERDGRPITLDITPGTRE